MYYYNQPSYYCTFFHAIQETVWWNFFQPAKSTELINVFFVFADKTRCLVSFCVSVSSHVRRSDQTRTATWCEGEEKKTHNTHIRSGGYTLTPDDDRRSRPSVRPRTVTPRLSIFHTTLTPPRKKSRAQICSEICQLHTGSALRENGVSGESDLDRESICYADLHDGYDFFDSCDKICHSTHKFFFLPTSQKLTYVNVEKKSKIEFPDVRKKIWIWKLMIFTGQPYRLLIDRLIDSFFRENYMKSINQSNEWSTSVHPINGIGSNEI